MKTIKIFSLFSGIGAFEKALDKLKQKNIIEYEIKGYSEIDKYASKAYSIIHNIKETMNYGDITKINEKKIPRDLDLITYGFPCQDISLAGKQKGLIDEKGNTTRSGLVWNATKIIKTSQPKIAIAENVKNLVSKKFSKEFKEILIELENANYNNYWKVLNAKDYGIAQNRERVFLISIRKDIDLNLCKWAEGEKLIPNLFTISKEVRMFPKKEELKKGLRDYLEEEVEEKYFLSDKMLKYLTDMTDRNGFVRGKRFNPHTIDSEYAYAITTNAGNRPTDNFIIMPEKTKKGYAIAEEGDGVYLDRPHQKRGVVQKGLIQTIKTSGSDVGVVVKDTRNMVTTHSLRIRKLTPKECWRLMGFDDEDHDKVKEAGISDAQRYKMAGNTIVVNVIKKILENLIKNVL